jgi:hypothetical protein
MDVVGNPRCSVSSFIGANHGFRSSYSIEVASCDAFAKANTVVVSNARNTRRLNDFRVASISREVLIERIQGSIARTFGWR